LVLRAVSTRLLPKVKICGVFILALEQVALSGSQRVDSTYLGNTQVLNCGDLVSYTTQRIKTM
jgi:hypothetical protein